VVEGARDRADAVAYGMPSRPTDPRDAQTGFRSVDRETLGSRVHTHEARGQIPSRVEHRPAIA